MLIDQVDGESSGEATPPARLARWRVSRSLFPINRGNWNVAIA
jgi:hypothetical protein